MSEPENISYSFGPFSVDPSEQTLRRNGEPVPLAPKAFDTLLVLLRNGGRLVSKEGLMRALWPDTFVEESNRTVHISALRRVFGEHNFVETVPKRGYRFQSGVIVRESTSVVIEEEEFDDEVSPDALAVLPFKLLSSEGESEYLGLGMADAVITRLSSINQIVRPTSAVSRFTSLEQDPAEVCRKLRVKTMLEGSIRREENRLRVRVQLVTADDFSTPLWAEQFDEQFTGILALEDAISERVATALMSTLTGEERKLLTKHQTENVAAYHHYLKGLYHANKWNIPNSHKAIEHYQQAIALDPDYALAYTGMADSYIALSHFYLAPSEAMQQARAAAERALELDESLAEGHHELALVEMWYDRNWTEVERRFKKAIALNESHAPSHLWYGYFLSAMGRFDAGMIEQRRAQELDQCRW
jgi:DNA-binding winged helix-turn-helix (wHTH) protein